MDHLHPDPTDGWIPTAERVIEPTQLAGPEPGGVGGRPAGFGPPHRAGAASPAPLTADDLEALEDLTFAEIARARGLDPDAVERLAIRPPRPRPSASTATVVSAPLTATATAPAPVTEDTPSARNGHDQPTAAPPGWLAPVEPAVMETIRIAPPAPVRPRPAVVHEVPAPQLPVWPPVGGAAPVAPAPLDKRLGPVPSKHRRYPGARARRQRMAAAVILLAAGAGTAAWFATRSHVPGAPASWDPRVGQLAGFVQHDRGLAWKQPVRIDFLTPASYRARFATVAGGPGPVGAIRARYVSSDRTVFVAGSYLDLYGRVAVVGGLTEALQDQYPGATSALADSEAVRIQADYVRTLTPAQQQVLRQLERG